MSNCDVKLHAVSNCNITLPIL